LEFTESFLIKGLGENIGLLVVGFNMRDNNIPFYGMVSQKMVSNAYVFGSRVLTWVISNIDGTLIVTYEWNMVHSVTIILESLSHPK
jgi:hypothetical protein